MSAGILSDYISIFAPSVKVTLIYSNAYLISFCSTEVDLYQFEC